MKNFMIILAVIVLTFQFILGYEKQEIMLVFNSAIWGLNLGLWLFDRN